VTAVLRPLVVATVALLLGAVPVSGPVARQVAVPAVGPAAGPVSGPAGVSDSVLLAVPVSVTGASVLAGVPAGGAQLRAGIVPSASGRDLPEGMLRDQRTAVAAVDEFWKRHFAEHFGRRYHSPLVVGAYLSGRGPSCDGLRPLPFNAFYCRPEDYLTWDQRLMVAGYRKVGRSWVYLIIAHEWGHAIQDRLNWRMVSVAAELQADCLAGATLAGAQRDRTLVGGPGDAQQIARTLTTLSDAYPWTKQTDHGNATQRINAYRRGFLGDVPACFPDKRPPG
jgi:predicted metalloprotease